jgi:hypothetical protein
MPQHIVKKYHETIPIISESWNKILNLVLRDGEEIHGKATAERIYELSRWQSRKHHKVA